MNAPRDLYISDTEDDDVTPVDFARMPPRGRLQKRSGVVDHGDVFSGAYVGSNAETPDPSDFKLRRVRRP